MTTQEVDQSTLDHIRAILKEKQQENEALKHFVYLIGLANNDPKYFNPQVENVLREIYFGSDIKNLKEYS